jgi:hypothetical protein
MTDEHYKAFGWCIKNNIKVYMVPIKGKKSVYIECDIEGQIIRSPNVYEYQNAHKDFPKKDASSKIWDLYLHLYKKFKDDKNSKH